MIKILSILIFSLSFVEMGYSMHHASLQTITTKSRATRHETEFAKYRDAVSKFINRGHGNLNTQDDEGRTVFHYLVLLSEDPTETCRDYDITHVCFRMEQDITTMNVAIRDKHGETPMDIALRLKEKRENPLRQAKKAAENKAVKKKLAFDLAFALSQTSKNCQLKKRAYDRALEKYKRLEKCLKQKDPVISFLKELTEMYVPENEEMQ